MKVKIIYSFSYGKLEKRINSFLEENEDKIEVIEIKWKTFTEHFAMIVYKIK